MDHDSTRVVLRAARAAARAADAPFVLAVSGGLDSMALLRAVTEVARKQVAAVATFDHGSGNSASASAEFVARAGANLGLPVVIGHAPEETPTQDGREASWRASRYEFLRSVAKSLGARLVTAHTEDDQVETVLMRVLRGSGARGLAGLYATSDIVRPFVGVRRADIRAYARTRGVAWRNDPTNRSRLFQRNRVRLDLLPALRRARPEIDRELLEIARRAAEWRTGIDRVAAELRPALDDSGGFRVASRELAGYDADSLCVLWSALAAQVGLALDWRGTRRLAAFTMSEPESGSVPLSGGWYMEARGGVYILGKRSLVEGVPSPLPASGELHWGKVRFRVEESATGLSGTDVASEPWHAALPMLMPATVRTWTAGDRLSRSCCQGARRVKRYLSDAGVRGQDRVGWPVVVDERENVVWIPGVRRADAATERSGRPVRHYVCERITR
jgi:tRNA(Ile)-lysidine synthase